MGGKRLQFAVSDIRFSDRQLDASQFALLTADVFASGNNAHDLPVSEETLKKTAKTIYNTPLLWEYDDKLDDAGTHSPFEVPCGFVPDWAEISYRQLPDGRLMMSTSFLVWKRYSGRLIEIFERDKEKSVSVEMEVFESVMKEDGKEELTDFAYMGTTILGTFITPAIPGAKTSMVDFAQHEKNEYELALAAFAKYAELDFTIPDSVKKNATRGLELHNKYGGGRAANLAVARYFVKNSLLSYQRVSSIGKSLRSMSKNISGEAKENDTAFVNFLLLGGKPGLEWIASLEEKMGEIDQKRLSYFEEERVPYKSLKDINPALKGIKPPISLAQANAIAKQADAIGTDEKKNGWAIAIANFKKTHRVEDGKWVKKEGGKTSMADEEKVVEPKPTEEMAQEPVTPEKMAEEELPEEEAKEAEEEKEEAEEEDKEARMSNNTYLDPLALMGFLEQETDSYMKIAAEAAKPAEERNYAVIADALFGAMKDMRSRFEDEKSRFAAENEELKKFKAKAEEEKRDFEVEAVLASVKEDLPAAEFEKALEESKQFSLENIEGWKNAVRAKAFEFSKQKKDESGKLSVVQIGLPFDTSAANKKDSLWG